MGSRAAAGRRRAGRAAIAVACERLEPRRLLSAAPVVQSIARSSPTTTAAAAVTYAVTFSAAVTGVDSSDFRLTTAGTVPGSPAATVSVSGSGAAYSVTVHNLRGSGSVQLSLVDDDSIRDAAGTPLGGAGARNGSFVGPLYTVQQAGPAVVSINRANPAGAATAATSVTFVVTFSSPVTGVAAGDFRAVATGAAKQTGLSVSPVNASVYNVTLSGVSGVGTLGLNLLDAAGTIRDAAGNRLATAGASFAAGAVYNVGPGDGQGAILADLNGDGRPDLIAPEFYGGRIHVRLGNGDGTFKPDGPAFPTLAQPNGLATADLNGDGKLDLIVSPNQGSSSHQVGVFLGNGDGTFGTQRTFEAGYSPQAVAAADMNGDGRPDVIVANNSNGGQVNVLLGIGDGTLAAPRAFAGGPNPKAIAVADFNADGKPDIVTANEGNGTLSFLLGNGDGTLGAARSVKAGISQYVESVAVADVNADGRPDVFFVNALDNTVGVLLGGPGGQLSDAGTYPTGKNASPHAVAVADMNKDGKPDLIVANLGSHTVGVLLGSGTGSFFAQRTYPVPGEPHCEAVRDLNGDGAPDVIVGNYVIDGVGVFLNQGDGTLRPPQAPPATAVGSQPAAIATADLNADGKPDVVAANQGDNTLSVLLGNGDGTFKAGQSYSAGTGPSAIAVADVNGDGRPDLAVADGSGNSLALLLGNGDGTFQPLKSLGSCNAPGSVAIGDLNGDGKADLAVGCSINSIVTVLFGNGDGTFWPPTTFRGLGYGADPVTITELNGDGKPDLLIGNPSPGSGVSLLLGNGDGTFQAPRYFATDSTTNGAAAADVNGDGRIDLLVDAAGVEVLIGNGDGSFQPPQSHYGVGDTPRSLAVFDANGDGVPDAVACSVYDDSISVLPGNGDGTFQRQRVYRAGDGPTALAVADLDGDGRPDVVTADSNGNTVSADLGNAVPTFVGQVYRVGPPTVVGVQVGSTAWSGAFVAQLNPAASAIGYAMPAGAHELDPLPWNDIDRVAITFSQAVIVTRANLTLAGIGGAPRAIAAFAYDPATFTATWTLAGAVASSDRLTLTLDGTSAAGTRDAGGAALLDGEWTVGSSGAFPSGDGAAGGDFIFTFNVLPGDANGDGTVNFADFVQLSNHFGQPSSSSPAADFNGDGTIDFADFVTLSNNFGRLLAAAVPSDAVNTSASSATSASGDLATRRRRALGSVDFSSSIENGRGTVAADRRLSVQALRLVPAIPKRH